MKKVSVTYVIYSSQKKADGSYPIKLRFIYNRKSRLISTNLSAHESDLIKLKPGDDSSKSREIKTGLLKRKAEDLVRKYEDAAENFDPYINPDLTVSDVIKRLDRDIHKDTFRLPFVEFSQSVIREKEKNSHQAALNYKAAVSSLSEFLKADEFDISRITSIVMRDFEDWLRKKHGTNARCVSLYTSTIATIHKKARLQYNSEELEVINIKNPFEYYAPPPQQKTGHRDIELEVIQGMINNYHTLQGQERVAIAAFLLSFGLMGMNTPDIYECPAPFNGVITYCRHKTRSRRADKALIKVKIPEQLLPLYNEYSDTAKKRAFNFYHRYASYKNMQGAEGDGMKKYMKRIGYEGRITNYSARHTWATIARSSKCKISIALIDDCLNHVGNHPIGDIYAKKDFSVLWEANEKVVSLLSWEPICQ